MSLGLVAFAAFGQQTVNEPVSGKSPMISPSGEVTFTISAPRAENVKVNGRLGKYTPVSSTKNEDGVWTITYSYLEPDLYDYWFEIDGIKTLDPSNPYVSRDIASLFNIFILPGGDADYYQSSDVPHGTVEKIWYDSPQLGATRRMTVYTPAGYEDGTDNYPVFYLLHGMGGDEDAWQDLGRSVQILDNMIASGKVKPMIVVMPNGNALKKSAPGYNAEGMYTPEGNHSIDPERQFEKAFPEIMQYVDSHYRTIPDKAHRAIAGLSMGGGHSWRISMNNPETFDYVGLFSPAVRWNGNGVDENEASTELVEKLQAQFANAPKEYIIYIGKDDFLYGLNESYRKLLDSNGFPYQYKESAGGHEWTNWRHYLVDFLPLLFVSANQ